MFSLISFYAKQDLFEILGSLLMLLDDYCYQFERSHMLNLRVATIKITYYCNHMVHVIENRIYYA
jgi:hypothetical protein